MKEKYTKAKMSIIIENANTKSLNAVFGYVDYYGENPEVEGEIGVGGSTNTPPTFPDDE